VLKPPHLHLTTLKVMVIVLRFRRNIIRTVLYIANVLLLQWAQLTKTVHTARFGLEFVFVCFLGCTICLYLVYVLFYLGQLSHFYSCCGAGVTNLNEPPSSLLLPPRYWVMSWLHPFKGHCEQKAMRDEGVIYVVGHPLLNRMYKTPRVFLLCKMQTVTSKGTI